MKIKNKGFFVMWSTVYISILVILVWSKFYFIFLTISVTLIILKLLFCQHHSCLSPIMAMEQIMEDQTKKTIITFFSRYFVQNIFLWCFFLWSFLIPFLLNTFTLFLISEQISISIHNRMYSYYLKLLSEVETYDLNTDSIINYWSARSVEDPVIVITVLTLTALKSLDLY